MRIVLVRPKISGNIGSVARSMANTGLEELFIVAPQCDPHHRDAMAMASRAKPLLQTAHVVNDLDHALHGVSLIAGTSCRAGVFREQSAHSPRAWAQRLMKQHDTAAVLFGPEDFGLSNDDLTRCDVTISIPSHEEYRSLNLAHAVLIVAYEYFAAGQESAPPTPSITNTSAQPADGALKAQMIERFRGPLARIGYLNPQDPDRLLIGLRNIFGKTNLTRCDVQMLMGLAQQIEKFAEHGYTPPDSEPRQP